MCNRRWKDVLYVITRLIKKSFRMCVSNTNLCCLFLFTIIRAGDDHIQCGSVSKVERAAYECLKNSVHDDEDLWCFRIPDFLPDSSSSSLSILHSGITNGNATTKTSVTSEQHSHSSNTIDQSSVSAISYWEKHVSPRANGFFFTYIGKRQEWVMTRGEAVGRYCGAAMVGMTRRLILFGGWDKDRWNLDENTSTARRKRLSGGFINGLVVASQFGI